MAIDPAAPRSRRAILAGALGGAGALIAHSLGRATPVAAATGDPLLMGKGNGLGENTADVSTRISSEASPTFEAHALSTNVALKASSQTGGAIQAVSASGIGVEGNSTGPGTNRSTGVFGHTGTGASLAEDTSQTGVYGFSDDSTAAVGVWGDSIQGTGVIGTGDWGVYGTGGIGVIGDANSPSVGVYGFSGDEPIIAPVAPAGVLGTAGAGGTVGVRGHAAAGASYGVIASAATTSQYALYVAGKLRLSRSGRVALASTATSKKILLAGVTTGSFVVATLQTNASGCYVKAVVPAAGSFTIYLSKAPGKTVAVGYVVVN